MKIKYLLTFFAIIKLSFSFSQTYLPLDRNRVFVFDDNDMSEGHSYIKVDSVTSNEIDILYLNRVVDHSDYSCVVLHKPSWLGEKLLVHPDGYCCFFNKDNDTITI